MKQWKIFSRKTSFKSPLFEVIETELELPSGKRRVFYTAERKPSVFSFALNENKELYLVKQYRYMLDSETIEASAGFIDENEEPLEAAKRELKEELGISADKWLSLGKVSLAASVFKSEAEMFLARELKFGDQKLDEAEDIEIVKITLDKALEMIFKGEIKESGTIIGILMIDKLIKEGKI